MSTIKFSHTKPRADQRHFINADDVRILLDPLRLELGCRLRSVNFNDRSIGVRHPNSPVEFGARRGVQWPHLAIRRSMLYDVSLPELGHLHIVGALARTAQGKYAREKMIQEFADTWRRNLWSQRLEHPDPVHNPSRRVRATELDA